MFIYRLTLTQFAEELTGIGSFFHGGRWSNVGTSCIYTAESRALAYTELSAHLTSDNIPFHLSMVTLKVPDDMCLSLSAAQLPEGWNSVPGNKETQDFGSALLTKAEHLIIRVPSVIIPQEFNYLINPLHADMKKLSIVDVVPFSFDTRLKN